MFQTIVLPIDLSDRHQQAVTTAAELAARGDGRVVLLHVIEVISGLSPEEGKGFYGRLEKAARDHLARLGGQLLERKVPWQAEVRYGHRGAEVVRYADEAKADLVVLTAPRLDPNNPAAGWGSLSYKVGLFSPCAVLLVK
jgi:nucleotide-binding universal stress UspA family protein